MRKFGDVLMAMGAALGVVLTAAMVFRSALPAMPWLLMVGMFKLGFAGAVGVIAAGAVVRRLAWRAEVRRAALETRAHL